MHILILPSWYPKNATEGAGSFFREQALALANAQHKVGIIAVEGVSHRSPYRFLRAFMKRAEAECDTGIATVRRLSPDWLPRIPYGIPTLHAAAWHAEFRRYVSKYGRPDIIQAHSAINAGAAAASISKKYGIPFVLTEHRSSIMTNHLRPWQKKLMINTAKSASARVAVSDAFADALTRYIGPSAGDWLTLHNLVSDDFFTYHQRPCNWKKICFVNVGFHTPRKRIDLVIEAFSRALAAGLDGELHLIGEGPETGRLKALAESTPYADRIVFCGNLTRQQTIEQIARSDFLVHAAQKEPFGVVIGEALALGKPVVATRSGGPEEMVTPDNGLLVPADDAAMLSAAMVDISQNADRYDPIRIRKMTRAKLGSAAFVDAQISIYRSVLA